MQAAVLVGRPPSRFGKELFEQHPVGPAMIHPAETATKLPSWSNLLEGGVRRALIVGVGLQILQQVSGRTHIQHITTFSEIPPVGDGDGGEMGILISLVPFERLWVLDYVTDEVEKLVSCSPLFESAIFSCFKFDILVAVLWNQCGAVLHPSNPYAIGCW